MERAVGTVVRGVRAPIIREGDVLEEVVAKAVLDCAAAEGVSFRDRDVVAVTEAIVARAQGNYATPDDIAEDVRRKTGGETAAVVFPITSRNRFAICLRGIARGLKKMVLLLSYPADEVGNHLIDLDLLDEAGVNPWSDVLTEARYRELFGETVHHFTGVDYVAYYRELVESEGCELTILFANDPREALTHT
ncbi:MAG: coenzyme F420-0:L-glutamate ligase, partial [Clostridia bacterium]|nr:coenzyme F420-0:L-glutamate ligase [Clostridia bacterium]